MAEQSNELFWRFVDEMSTKIYSDEVGELKAILDVVSNGMKLSSLKIQMLKVRNIANLC